MSDRYTPEQITAAATDAAFAAGFLTDLAGRTGALVVASGAFAEQARAAWSGPRADNDLALVDGFRRTLDGGIAASLSDLAALLDELFEAGAEYGRELATHVYWRDTFRARHRAHARGDWASCGCPVDELSGDRSAAEQFHGPPWRESQLLVDSCCGGWREVLERAAALMPPLAASVTTFCNAPPAAGEFSTSALSRGELVAAVLANRPSSQFGIELFGLGAADVAEYFASGSDTGLLSGAELGAALSPLNDEELAAVWPTFPPAQRAELIDHRPDVASRVVPALSRDEVWQMREAIAHPVLTHDFTQRFGIELGVRVGVIDLGIEVGSTNNVYVVKMSDGTVVVGVGIEDRFGVFTESAVPGNGTHLGVGMLAFGEHVYEFDTEDEAAAAIDSLRRAADRSAAEFVVDIFTDSALERVIDELDAANLISAASGSGGYVDAALTIERVIDAGIELDVTVANYSRAEYAAPGSTELTAVQGVVAAGAITATARAPGPVTGGSGVRHGVELEGSFVLDVRTETASDGSRAAFLTVTLTGGAAAGVGSALVATPSRSATTSRYWPSTAPVPGVGATASGPAIDGAVLAPPPAVRGERSTTVEIGTVTAIEITLPIDPGANALDIARQVATLDYFDALSAEQLAVAEIVVTRDDLVVSESQSQIDALWVGLAESTTVTRRTNVSTIHKPPHGSPYSSTDLNHHLEELL